LCLTYVRFLIPEIIPSTATDAHMHPSKAIVRVKIFFCTKAFIYTDKVFSCFSSNIDAARGNAKGIPAFANRLL